MKTAPKANWNTVAEHTLGMLLKPNEKNLESSFDEVKAGHWIRAANRGTGTNGQDCRHYRLWQYRVWHSQNCFLRLM